MSALFPDNKVSFREIAYAGELGASVAGKLYRGLAFLPG